MILKKRGEAGNSRGSNHEWTTGARRPEIIGKTVAQPRDKISFDFKILKNFFYLLIIIFMVYIVFFSDVFKIKRVDLVGVKSVEISDYINRGLIGKNIILLQTGSYLRELTKKFPVLEQARIVRGLPDTISLELNERNQVLIWCNTSGCFEVDNNGYAYQKIDKPVDKIALYDDGNVEVKEGSRVATEQFIAFFLDALKDLDSIGVKVKEAHIAETTFKVSFVTSDGWQAVFDSSYSLGNQISALQQVIEKNRSDIKEYVDLRVEGVAYIK